MRNLKLTKKEAERIAEKYNLGEVLNIKSFSGGFVNYNYELETIKGKFVIRLLGVKVTKVTLGKLANEFKVLSYLHEKKFPYSVPYPLKNKKGKYLFRINKNTCWIYPKINGGHIKEYDEKAIQSIAKALAVYHKYVSKVKIIDDPRRKIYGPKKLAKLYKIMKKQKPNSERNKIMLANIAFFEEVLDKIRYIDFNINLLPVHYDFHKDNLLFEKEKVVGILDFERLRYAPRILDIAHLIKCTCEHEETKFKERMNFIIREYSKINPLTKKEIRIIPLILAKDNCRMFEVFYTMANKDGKAGVKELLACLEWTIDVQKNIAKTEGWIK